MPPSRAFATERADQPFHIRRLPGRAWGNELLLDAQTGDPADELRPINGIRIPHQVLRHRIVREGVDDLLGGPRGGGRLGNVKMNNLAASGSLPLRHTQDIQQMARHGGHHQEIHTGHPSGMLFQKGPPTLRAPLPRGGQYFRIVEVKTAIPNFANSSRLRGLPQVGFTAHIRRIS